ncbi:MAG: chemotaxis protein CheW, partial [Chloroflexota bacterium]|nr:chemotaxis protein CheW [Chloroflexota bacterium]
MAIQPADALYQQVVVFDLSNETYALDITYVIEIIRILPITPVPGAPYYVEGLLNLRGRVVAVVDLRKRFGLPLRATGEHSRIIVVQVGDDIVGAIVDAVSEVVTVSPDVMEPAGRVVTALDAEFIRGIAKLEGRLVAVLNPDKILEFYGQGIEDASFQSVE